MVGPITLVDSGDEIDCSRMGSGGYGIPSIVEPEVIQFKKCDAKFILHVEKDTVWQRFNEDKFWRKHNCILTHGGGQPPRGVRRMLNRLHNELKLPIYCLLDNDPWGYYIYSVIKQGSINLALRIAADGDSRTSVILGLRSKDFERCQLSDSVKINLNDNDIKRAKQIAGYPWFAKKAVAEGDREDAQERLQAGSRIADLERHQLRDRRVRAGAAGGSGLVGNTAWVLLAAFLVFGMQVGFTMLEAGFCRSRETVNVLMECIVDTCLCGHPVLRLGLRLHVRPRQRLDRLGRCGRNKLVLPAKRSGHVRRHGRRVPRYLDFPVRVCGYLLDDHFRGHDRPYRICRRLAV